MMQMALPDRKPATTESGMKRAHVIGSGRLGRHLANRLDHLGIAVTRWNRSPQNGTLLLTDWQAGDAPDLARSAHL